MLDAADLGRSRNFIMFSSLEKYHFAPFQTYSKRGSPFTALLRVKYATAS
jgi:hypothetical protein